MLQGRAQTDLNPRAADIKIARDEGAKQRAEINKQESTTQTP